MGSGSGVGASGICSGLSGGSGRSGRGWFPVVAGIGGGRTGSRWKFGITMDLTIDSFSSLGYCSKMTEPVKHKIRIVMGDPSGDGHGRSSEKICASNLSGAEMNAAYKVGTNILGFDYCGTVCDEYEDCTVPLDVADKLIKHGCRAFDKLSKYDLDPEKGYSIWYDDHLAIYLFICKLGNPEFQYELISNQMEQINIGGYGFGS